MVYIPPRSSTIGMATLPCRNPVGASRKTREIFEDRIFHSTTNANQPSTPTQNLRSFEGLQTLSAPAATRINYKPIQNTLMGTRLARRADGHQFSPSKIVQASRGANANLARSLRRRQTVHDLRSSDSAPRSESFFDKPSPQFLQQEVYPKGKDERSHAIPLSSRTNQSEVRPLEHLPADFSKKAMTSERIFVENPENHDTQTSAAQQSLEKSNSGNILHCNNGLHQVFRSPSHNTVMSDNVDTLVWCLRNVSDHIGRSQDFLKPVTRSDTTPPKDLNPHVQRIDVTTFWNGLSPADAEELFRIHIIFRNSLKSLCSKTVEGMLSLVKKNFLSKEGNFATLDGFRVGVLDKWIPVDREEIIHTMTTLGHDYFSQTEHQPNRSALLQLYLSSTECFLDWDKYEKRFLSSNTGVSMRTFYDQLSEFEVPTARAASFGDYVRFKDLNPTPREDEELTIIPQYNRDGIFVQSPYPDDVKYHMETPVTWLGWDDSIKGFRGRIPIYSAFSDSFDFDRDVREDGISHVLNIVLNATFKKHCTTGPAYFERLVRMRLTLYILPKHPSSVEHSVYGVERRQKPCLLPHRDRFSNASSSGSSSLPKSSESGASSFTNGTEDKQREDTFSIPKRPTLRPSSPLEKEESKIENAMCTAPKNGLCSKKPIYDGVDRPLTPAEEEEARLWERKNAKNDVEREQLAQKFEAKLWEHRNEDICLEKRQHNGSSCLSNPPFKFPINFSINSKSENESGAEDIVEIAKKLFGETQDSSTQSDTGKGPTLPSQPYSDRGSFDGPYSTTSSPLDELSECGTATTEQNMTDWRC